MLYYSRQEISLSRHALVKLENHIKNIFPNFVTFLLYHFFSKGSKYAISSFEHEKVTRYQAFIVIYIPIYWMFTGDEAGVLKQIRYFNLRNRIRNNTPTLRLFFKRSTRIKKDLYHLLFTLSMKYF